MRDNIYEIRQPESTIKQSQFEYLQNGLLARYNMRQVERTDMEETTLMWEYDELKIYKHIKQEELPEFMEKVVLPIVDKMRDQITEVNIQESQKDLPTEFKQEVERYLQELFLI